jgi:hypothetical protein
LAEYRAGHLDAARDWFTRSRSVAETADSRGEGALPSFFLALAQQRLGREEAARESLAGAVRRMDQAWPQGERAEIADWRGWVHCQAARREAEALIAGK